MPTFSYGYKASVWMDNYDVSAFFNEVGTALDISTAETSTFQSNWKTYVEGLPGGKVNVKGFYTYGNDAYLQTNIMDGGSVLTAIPAGSIPTAIGDVARLAWIHDTDFSESSPVGGAVLTPFWRLNTKPALTSSA